MTRPRQVYRHHHGYRGRNRDLLIQAPYHEVSPRRNGSRRRERRAWHIEVDAILEGRWNRNLNACDSC